MAKVLFRLDPPQILHTFDVAPDPDWEYSPEQRDADNHWVVDSDIDETQVHFSNLGLNADKTKVVVLDPSKTYAESLALHDAAEEAKEIVRQKASKVKEIKLEAKERLRDLAWKIERAQETDLLNGNNVAMTAIATEKKTIRDANNAHETTLQALTTLQEVQNFQPKAF